MTPQVNKDKAQPFIRWAGSKRRLLPVLKELIPCNFERYIEPFAGSACLFFSLEQPKAILGDINTELINTYKQIKINPESVSEQLHKFNLGEKEYYRIRGLDLKKLSKKERAARFIFLNRFCFNGLYRTNKKGTFNVPYGGHKSGSLPSIENLMKCSEFLSNTIIVSGSFEKTLQKAKEGDFVYLDPPYSINSRRIFNEYSNVYFGESELKGLRNQMKHLNKNGIFFLVSYGLSEEARLLAKGFRTREVIVHRQIAGFADSRRRYKDLLITNY